MRIVQRRYDVDVAGIGIVDDGDVVVEERYWQRYNDCE